MSYSRAQSAGEAGLMEGAKQIFADNLKTMEPIAERNTTLPRIPRKRNGGARRDRTDDLMLAKHALSQLSYGPIKTDATGRRCATLWT